MAFDLPGDATETLPLPELLPLRGRVLALDGMPVANVRVHLQPLTQRDSPQPARTSKQTGGQGAFRFDGLIAGRYRLTCTGYEPLPIRGGGNFSTDDDPVQLIVEAVRVRVQARGLGGQVVPMHSLSMACFGEAQTFKGAKFSYEVGLRPAERTTFETVVIPGRRYQFRALDAGGRAMRRNLWGKCTPVASR